MLAVHIMQKFKRFLTGTGCRVQGFGTAYIPFQFFETSLDFPPGAIAFDGVQYKKVMPVKQAVARHLMCCCQTCSSPSVDTFDKQF